jgi:uncharacterized membrane protein YkoI
MRAFLALPIIAAAVLSTPPAVADEDCRGPVSRWQAIQTARSVGLVRVEEIECDDGRWEIEGTDRRGREIEVEVSARTGRILEIDRD